MYLATLAVQVDGYKFDDLAVTLGWEAEKVSAEQVVLEKEI